MLCGSPVGDDVDRRGVNEVIAVFSGILLERVYEDLQISLRDLADEFSGRLVVQIDHRSPLSPCPLCTFVFAFVRQSAVSDLPTSSDSLKRPVAPRRTNRLSVPVLMSSRFAAFWRPPVFLAAPF
jgi:hypothetical protein